MKKITLIIALAFFISSNAQDVTTNGTILLDDATSRTRVVVDAFLNSSNRVHELIEEIAPSYGGDFTTNNTVLVNTIETVSPKTSLEPSTNYTDLVADNITNLLLSAIDKKADKTRDCRVIGSVVVPERISGSGWSHTGDYAAADVGELTYNSYFSEQEGVVVWTGTAPYTIVGEEGTFYTWAIAVYDAFSGTFVGYCSQGNGSADIEYDIDGMVSDSFTSFFGLSWQDSFATLNTPEPDALNWGNVEGIAMLGQITVSTSVTGVEHVVYSGELATATNDLFKSFAPTITNTVTKAYVEDLGIESGISASTSTNIAGFVAQTALGSFAETGTVQYAEEASTAIGADSAEDAYNLRYGEDQRSASQIFTVLDESASTNYAQTAAANAVENADTTYRRTIGITNLNQSVQYVNITDTAPTTLAISMPTDGATKDWMVYVVSVTNVTLSLPSATWWMADTAYTNDVPPATPTAFWFSQVTDGIYILGRQDLTEVAAP